MKKLIIAFVLGMIVGFALAMFIFKKEMPLYTDPAMLDEAREAFDGSIQSIQQGRKNLLP